MKSILQLQNQKSSGKLSPTLSLHLSIDTPMMLQYKLGNNTEDDPNYLRFYLAAKIDDM